MSEITPDAIAKLAKFTPANTIDHAGLLFEVGRASARTHWVWRAAVAGLLLTNAVTVVLLALRPTTPATHADTRDTPILAKPELPQTRPPAGAATPEPWSYRSLSAAGDPERFPVSEPIRDGHPHTAPLTVLSGRRGEID